MPLFALVQRACSLGRGVGGGPWLCCGSGDQPHGHAAGLGVLTRGAERSDPVGVGRRRNRSWLGHSDPLLLALGHHLTAHHRLSLSPGAAPIFAVGGGGAACLPASGGPMVAPHFSLSPPPRHLSALCFSCPQAPSGHPVPTCVLCGHVPEVSCSSQGARGLSWVPKGPGFFPFPPSGARMKR